MPRVRITGSHAACESRVPPARRGTGDRDGLVPEHSRDVGWRTRHPIDRVLQDARDRVVVLGRHEQKAVRRGQTILQLLHGKGTP
jgi:hypothetical protein